MKNLKLEIQEIFCQSLEGHLVDCLLTDLFNSHHARPEITALVAYNDGAAIEAHHTLLNLGIRLPEDIALVGFDDLEAGRVLQPGLTPAMWNGKCLEKWASSACWSVSITPPGRLSPLCSIHLSSSANPLSHQKQNKPNPSNIFFPREYYAHPQTVLTKYSGNPIISPKGMPFPCETVYNSGVAKFKDKYVLLLRCGRHDGRSVFGLAMSDDGYHFQIHPEPVFSRATEGIFNAPETREWKTRA